MGIKTLPQAHPDKEREEQLRRAALSLITRMLFAPLLKVMDASQSKLSNAGFNALIEAIRAGRIVYRSPHFTGKLSASVSRELRNAGARWNKKTRVFEIEQGELDPMVAAAIRDADAAFLAYAKRVDRTLAQILPAENAGFHEFGKIFDKMIMQNESALDKTLSSITVAPNLSPNEKLRLLREWRDNMALDIKTFVDSEVVSLRDRIAKHVLKGGRYEAVMAEVQASYGVSKSKAKFLARQETNLLLSKMQELRCTRAGVDDYYWRCVKAAKNHPVRPMHQALDGTLQKFSKPPITSKNGDRNNPGEDYNCRCLAVPVVRI